MAHLTGPELQARRRAIDPKSIFRCPCGFESTLNVMQGHRYGIKKHPEKHLACLGPLAKRWEPSQEEHITPAHAETPEIPTAPRETTTEPPPQTPTNVSVYEYQGTDEELPEQIPDDPETVARRLREQLNAETPTGVGGDGRGELEGDFIVEQTAGPVSLQHIKQTVELPPVVLVWYDYYKNQGWMQGDGSISSFVTDFLLDHIRNCLGMRVIIVSETEVEIVEQSRSE